MKKVISLLMVITLLLSIVTMMAFGLTSNGFTYTVEDGEATITACNGSSSSITIPETLGGVPVTAIGDYAFANRAENGGDITALSLPSSLKHIGDGAFDVNSTVTSLTVPANVESIGKRAFHCWIKLSVVNFAGDKLKSIGDWAFKNAHSLSGLALPASVEEIGEGAFAYCTSLSSVTIPASVKSLGSEAFLACTSLANVTFEGKNTGIGDNAFDLTAASGDTRSLKVYGYNGSSAQRFAAAESFGFVALPDPTPDDPTPDDPTPDDPTPDDDFTPGSASSYEAAGSGAYFVKITYSVTDGNNFEQSYGGFNKEVNDSAGISVLCRGINGTASVEKEKKWDIGTQMKTEGTYTVSASLDGFPTLLYGYLDDNYAFGLAEFNINKLEVGSSANNLKTVWTGKICLSSKISAYGVSLDWNNTEKRDYIGTDKNNLVKETSGAWEKPYAKDISAFFQNNILSLQKNQQSVSNPFTYAATDQYGVPMDLSLCKSVKAFSSENADTASFAVEYGNGKGSVGCDKALHLAALDKNDQTVSLAFTWKGKDSTKTGNVSFTLEDEKYTVTWLDASGGIIAQEEEYFGQIPLKEVPAQAADDTYHYQNGRWDKELTAVTQDVSYQAVYDVAKHAYVLDESRSVTGNCVRPGLSVYVCSECGHTWQETEPASGNHAFKLTQTVKANCQNGGYTVYTCESCGETYTGDYVDALGHDFSVEDPCEDAIRSTGSWDKNATFYYTCSRCGTIDYRGSYFEYVTAGIRGTVDMSNQYKPVTVILLKDGEEFDRMTLKTTSDGSFMFCELDPGSAYSLVFEGESTTLAEIEAVDLAAGEKMDLNVNENSEISTISVTLGDINIDGLVDVKDISEILVSGVYATDNAAADINNSGAVDIVDVGIVLQSDNYGSSAKHLKV